jgi:hypothetical protein
MIEDSRAVVVLTQLHHRGLFAQSSSSSSSAAPVLVMSDLWQHASTQPSGTASFRRYWHEPLIYQNHSPNML